MIAPFAVILLIAAGQPFLPESDLCEQIFRGFVGGKAGGLDAVQTERGEHEWYQRAHRVEHVTLTRVAFADPIPERTALRDTPPHVGERATAHQDVAVLAEHKERVRRIGTRFLLVAFDTAAIGALAEFVARPDGFPRRQKFAALAAHRSHTPV